MERVNADMDVQSEGEQLRKFEPIFRGMSRDWKVPGYERDDLESVAMVAGLEALRSYDPSKGPIESWIRRRIQHTFMDVKRKEQRRLQPSLMDSINELVSSCDESAIVAFKSETTQMQSRTLTLIARGMTQAEIARMRGTSRQAVNKQVKLVRMKIELVRGGGTRCVN